MDAKSSLRNRSRRNRFSVSRLSTDSTATLPAYPRPEISPDDRPPDYPESADEADADTSHSTSDDTLLPLSSPRPRRLHAHRRRRTVSPIVSSHTEPDPYLDSLLARSVHALEMSNALLQSSISTHSSLSAVLAADSPVVESSLEARARNLSSRIGTNSSVQADWLDDLAVISEHFATDARPDALGLSLAHDDPVSRSLPVGPSPLQLRSSSRHHRNRSSSDLHHISAESTEPDEPHLRLSNWPRSRLISPAPRAITQYVEANADPDTILLPSTLGLRSTPSAHLPPRSPSPPPPPSPGPSSPLSCPTPPEPSSTVYTLLSSFLKRRPSTSSISRPPTSFRFGHRPRASTDTTTSSSHAPSTAPSLTRSPYSSPARSRASKRPMTPPLIPPSLVLTTRPLTPPTENPSLSSLSSSSSNPSSDPHINPVLSLQALRKILDDQPNASPMSRAQSDGHATRRPTFLPRTPLPAPTLGTSTATASVSRLFTKPVHMHSGSSSRETRPSALKGGLRTPQSPASSDGFLAPSSTGPGGSSGSSARSTPKRISFADLPEPYGSERGGGGSGRGFEKRSARRGKKRSGKGKGKGKGKSRVDVEDDSDESDDDDFEKGWWARLLLGSGQVRGLSLGRPEDRIEARIARGLGSRGGFGGGMEDWAI
jgi:hypothetical protein